MSFYGDQVLPRLMNVLLADGEWQAVRERVSAGLQGEVLEVGFGSGLNVPFYPPQVQQVFTVEPSRVGRGLARARVASSTVPIEFIGTDGESLPLDAEQIDCVLITWTMCTIPAVEMALREMHRVLRTGGEIHFVEHGRSPDSRVARWQDRLNPLQRKLAGGCNLNRPIDRLVTGAGFSMTRLENFYVKGPKPLSYTYEGVATKS